MDRFGLLPGPIAERYAREEVIDQHLRQASALDKALKAMDPEIRGVCFVRDNSPEVIQTPEGLAFVKPGRWHVRRRRPGLPDAFMAIETESGGYREPDSGVLYELQAKDMQNRGPSPEALIARSAAERNRNTAPDLREEMASDIRAARRVAGENLGKRRWGRK